MDMHTQMELSSYPGIEGLQNYNNFFNPNVCHVCKTPMQKRLKPCSDCHMISYCSEEHRMLHLPQHKELCEVIVRTNQTWGLWDTRGKVRDDWPIFTKRNVFKITQVLYRELEPYEEQMFMFAKSCLICRDQYNLVTTCEVCFSANSCADHNLNCVMHDCAGLKLALMLNINYLAKEQNIKGFSFYYEMNISYFPYDMASFLLKFTMEDGHRYSWQLFDFHYSDWLSEPLTMCQILMDTNYQYLLYKADIFIIHVIAGDRTDKHSWKAWEVLLHLLCPEVTVKIIIIDANSSNFDIEQLQVCPLCNLLKKNISIHCRGASYEDYMKNTPHEQPDVILGYHVDLNRFRQQTIQTLYKRKCPIILTTVTQNKSDNNIRRLQEVLGIFALRFITTKNNFASQRPYRDYESDCIFIRNQYLVICDVNVDSSNNLGVGNSSNNLIQTSNSLFS